MSPASAPDPDPAGRSFKKPLAPGDLVATLYSAAGGCVRVLAAVDAHIRAASHPPSPDAGWIVPCDIVGLDSKKAKHAKIRFNPSTLSYAAKGGVPGLAEAINAAIEDLLGVVCSNGEWDRSASAVDRRPAEANKIVKLFARTVPQIAPEGDGVAITWLLHAPRQPSSSMNLKELEEGPTTHATRSQARIMRDVREILAGYDAPNQPLEVVVTNVDVDGFNQCIEINYTNGDFQKALWRLRLDGKYLQESTEKSQPLDAGDCMELDGEKIEKIERRHAVEVTPQAIVVHLVRKDPRAVTPPPSPELAVAEPGESEMLDAAQTRVEELRRRLDASLVSAKRTHNDELRQLIVLTTDRCETAIEICEAGARPRKRTPPPPPSPPAFLSPSTPLKVLVAATEGFNIASDGESPIDHLNTSPDGGEYASSPSDSTDSGYAFSSPTDSPKASPFYQYSGEASAAAKFASGMRARSLSESASTHVNGLKGILKKTSAYGPSDHLENARRMRGVFKRSMSESGDSSLMTPFAYRTLIHEDAIMEEVKEEDEEGEESEEGSDDAIADTEEETPRTKRVSFSENVEKRHFRPNSSICSQRTKNARKERSKRRREERKTAARSASESDATDLVYTSTEDDGGKGGEFAAEKASLRETRKDSGFCDDDEDGGDDDVIESGGEDDESPSPFPSGGGNPLKKGKDATGAGPAIEARPKCATFTIGGDNRDWMRGVVSSRRRWESTSN